MLSERFKIQKIRSDITAAWTGETYSGITCIHLCKNLQIYTIQNISWRFMQPGKNLIQIWLSNVIWSRIQRDCLVAVTALIVCFHTKLFCGNQRKILLQVICPILNNFPIPTVLYRSHDSYFQNDGIFS